MWVGFLWAQRLQVVKVSVFLAIVFLADVADAAEFVESLCEENADDLKRLAYWLIVLGVLAGPIGIGAVIVQVGAFLWFAAEFWWALC
jgi:hypothetical protein